MPGCWPCSSSDPSSHFRSHTPKQDTLLLKAPACPVFQLHAEQSHPRLSILRVLRVRFLRWLDKASSEAIWKAVCRVTGSFFLGFFVFLPDPTLHLFVSAARWNDFRIPLFLQALVALAKAKRLVLWLKRTRVKARGVNQQTFRGVPVGELAAFKIRHDSFKPADATKELALTRDQYDGIAEDLEKYGVLTRGEKNARVLRPIGMTLLVEQLRDNLPYAWDEDTGTWNEKNEPRPLVHEQRLPAEAQRADREERVQTGPPHRED